MSTDDTRIDAEIWNRYHLEYVSREFEKIRRNRYKGKLFFSSGEKIFLRGMVFVYRKGRAAYAMRCPRPPHPHTFQKSEKALGPSTPKNEKKLRPSEAYDAYADI